MGEPIDHPAGYKIKITRPLDFMAVTDHAEYIGVVPLANDPNSPISKLPIAEKLKVRSQEDIMRVYMRKSQGQYRQGLILARSGSPSFVAVVKSADEGWRYDGSHLGRVNRPWLR